MKILCTIENLKKGFMIAEKVIGRNLTLPILSNILIEAEKGVLKLLATNLEIGVVCRVRAKIEKEGKIAVPGRLVSGFLSQLRDGEKIVLEAKDSVLKMVCGESDASIKGLDAKDFPLIPKPQTKALLEINAHDFQLKVNKIMACAATSETRQELTGIFMGFSPDKITLAATDSFRLAEAVIKLKKEQVSPDYKSYIEKNESIIVPAKTFLEVVRSIAEGSSLVKIYIADNQIFFESDDSLFVSRLIDGKYPEYRQVIPKSFTSDVKVHRDNLMKAVKLSSIFSDSKSREIKIKTEGGKEKISIKAESMETGENVSTVEGEVNSNGVNEIAFNSRYLVDCLGSISTEMLWIGFNDSFGPVIFREIVKDGKVGSDYLHIIMPIRS